MRVAGARRGLLLLAWAAATVLLAGAARAEDGGGACRACHREDARALAASAHARIVGCVDCHGGTSSVARQAGETEVDVKARAHAGLEPVPERAAVGHLCARCHEDPVAMAPYALPTDQLTHYRTSAHGRRLYDEGDEEVAICTDCHRRTDPRFEDRRARRCGTCEILSAREPTAPTAPHNQPAMCGRCHDAESEDGTSVVEAFRHSVHGRALAARTRGAPSCSDCHGSHGAHPPGVRDVVEVCGHCHESTQEHYRASPHATSEEMRCAACHEDEDSRQYRRSGCATCHGAHAIAEPGEWLFEGEEPGHCAHCHDLGDEPAVGEFVRTVLDGTRRLGEAMRVTQEEIDLAKARGLFIEHEELYVRESQRALVGLKPLAHSLDGAAVAARIANGLADQEREREKVRGKRKELRDRRIVLSGLAAFLLLLAGLLALKLDAVRRLS